MSDRRSLKLPITLGVVLILLIVVLIVGWVLLNVYGALGGRGPAPLYWALLSVGCSFLVMVLGGVVIYLVFSVQAIKLAQRQSNFVDSVTHELKSPLASLKLYLQTLSRYPVSAEEQSSFCSYMLEDLDRLDRLINHLLDTAHLDKKKVAKDREIVDVAELLTQGAETACARYRITGDAVTFDLEPAQMWAVRGDLELVFGNLLDNAVKYAGSPPHLEVTLRTTPEREVVVHIGDNGRGIPRKLRRKIFGRFVRLGSELQRETPGTGLGLYIVRTLVSQMKGRVHVTEGSGGVGTVFKVRLPQGEPAVAHAAESDEPIESRVPEELDVA